MAMRFQVGDRIYTAAGLEDISLRDILDLELQTAEMGRVLRIGDIKRMSAEIEALATDEERSEHPDAIWMTAVCIWMSRRQAGDSVTFAQACDIPMSRLTLLPDTSDHRAAANPTSARPATTRRGSGRATVKRTTAAGQPTRSTSGGPSTAE